MSRPHVISFDSKLACITFRLLLPTCDIHLGVEYATYGSTLILTALSTVCSSLQLLSEHADEQFGSKALSCSWSLLLFHSCPLISFATLLYLSGELLKWLTTKRVLFTCDEASSSCVVLCCSCSLICKSSQPPTLLLSAWLMGLMTGHPFIVSVVYLGSPW